MPPSRPFRRASNWKDSATTDRLFNGTLEVIGKGQRVIVVAGAGISEAARVEPLNNEITAVIKHGKVARAETWARYLDSLQAARPTTFHSMVDRIAGQGRLLRMYTENIDGIEAKTRHLNPGVLPHDHHSTPGLPLTVQIRGSLRQVSCSSCQHVETLSLDTLASASAFPTCTSHACSQTTNPGKLTPSILADALHKGALPTHSAIDKAVGCDISNAPDVLLVVGINLASISRHTMKRRVARIADAVNTNRGLCAWLNIKPPTDHFKNNFLQRFDAIVTADCLAIAGMGMRFMDWWRDRRDAVDVIPVGLPALSAFRRFIKPSVRLTERSFQLTPEDIQQGVQVRSIEYSSEHPPDPATWWSTNTEWVQSIFFITVNRVFVAPTMKSSDGTHVPLRIPVARLRVGANVMRI